jgi:hypothetical protein
MSGGSGNSAQALVLQCSVEALHVRIVVALTDAGMSMVEIFAQEDVREAGGELGAVVGLDHFKREWGFLLSSGDERSTLVCAQFLGHFRIRPPRVQINERVHVQT